jgi:hypothetical protein
LHAPALQTQVLSAVYVISFLDDIPNLAERLQRVISAEHLPRLRRNKTYDLRPLIEDAEIIALEDNLKPRLKVQLSARDSATGRPEELLAELDVQFQDTHVHREILKLSPV